MNANILFVQRIEIDSMLMRKYWTFVDRHTCSHYSKAGSHFKRIGLKNILLLLRIFLESWYALDLDGRNFSEKIFRRSTLSNKNILRT